MKTETVRKTSQARSGKSDPAHGEKPSRKTNADIGALTRGSSGTPKGTFSRRQGRADGSVTRANKTTSVGPPPVPVPKDFLNKLGEMYMGEWELTLALPLMIASAKSADLKALLRLHLTQTKGHAKALQAVAASLRRQLPLKPCAPVTRLIAEGTKVMARRLISSNEDAGLIAVGRKVEQFEVDSYTALCATAREHEYTHERALLASILAQEKLALELLGALGAGKGPLKQLLQKASLKKAGA